MILCVCPNPAIDKYIYINNFNLGEVNRVSKELSYPGGKGVHVALGLREFGEEVALLSIWGGVSGKWIKKQCEAAGIVCYGPEIKDYSRTCLTVKSDNEYDDTEILGASPIINALEYAEFEENYTNLLKKSDLVSLSGSWPKNSIGANYSKFIEKASLLNIKTFIDCSGEILISALEKKPFAVHINHHEAFDIYKSNNPLLISLKLINCSKIIAITYGDKGLYLYDGKKLVHALSKVENIISSVGSGDSLMAGLIVAHLRNYNLIETAKLAAASGAANCIRESLGMFYLKDVERLVKSCDVSLK